MMQAMHKNTICEYIQPRKLWEPNNGRSRRVIPAFAKTLRPYDI